MVFWYAVFTGSALYTESYYYRKESSVLILTIIGFSYTSEYKLLSYIFILYLSIKIVVRIFKCFVPALVDVPSRLDKYLPHQLEISS